ncbi:MAG TPA: hypothetical protein PLJ60_00630 [Chryseolinea sp.]|nr:hypothetical protein [Chryseolinea sp.]
MSLELIYFSSYLQLFGSFLIAALGLLYFSKRDKTILIIAFYGLNSCVFQIANSFSPRIGNYIVNNIVANVYTFTEAFILLYFFFTLFPAVWSKKLTIVFGILYTILYFVLIRDHWQEAIGSIRMLRDLLMIVCSLFYFYFLISNLPTTQITRYPMFWIVAAFIFFFSGTFVLSLSTDYLHHVLKNDFSYLWPARNFFRFFFCLVVSYGLLLDLREVKMKQPAQR